MRNRLSMQIKDLDINEIEEEIIIGCLLGDGTLSKSGKYHRLRIEQQSKHKEYVVWKFCLLRRLCVTLPQYNKKNQSYRFGTVGHPTLTKIHSTFLGINRSIDPMILEKISSLSLAIWFMDDGYRIHNTIGISTNNFSETALKQLQEILKDFGISTNLQKDKKGKRIYILSSSFQLFHKLVKPYVDQVQCMAYKLPNPVETTRWLPGNWDEDIVQSPQ